MTDGVLTQLQIIHGETDCTVSLMCDRVNALCVIPHYSSFNEPDTWTVSYTLSKRAAPSLYQLGIRQVGESL